MHFDLWFTLFVTAVTLIASAGVVLLLVGYLEAIAAAASSGRKWLAVVTLIPLAGPIYFCQQHWQDCRKTGLRLLGGSITLAIGVGLAYGFGPWFAARAMAPLPPL